MSQKYGKLGLYGLSSNEMKDIITIIATIKRYIDSHINESVECIETSAGILNNQESVF